MKGYRFYLEFPDHKTKKKSGKSHVGHKGIVYAAELREDGNWNYRFSGSEQRSYVRPNDEVECFTTPTNPVVPCLFYEYGMHYEEVSIDWIEDVCKRIPERLARELAPDFFEELARLAEIQRANEIYKDDEVGFQKAYAEIIGAKL